MNQYCAENIAAGEFDRQNEFYNLLDHVPMVLAAAGPSLQKNMEFLKKYREQIFIGAVGTALTPLRNNEIVPDFFMWTDSLESLSAQFARIPESVQKVIPLFYLSTVMPSVVFQYRAPKLCYCSKMWNKQKKLLVDLI